MKKLRLEVEQLEVESFSTVSGPKGERGTVRGLAGQNPTDYPQETCFPGVHCPIEYSPHWVSCDPNDCVSLDCLTPGEATTDPNDQACGGG